MKVSHIVAMSSNRAIGRNGGMPWHIPKDFRFFKETTMGHAMIMGRKTWESIGKALPGRKTIVVTRSQDLKVPSEVLVMTSVEAALSWCRDNQTTWGDECFIVGGGDIYRQTISKADRIYLTEVHIPRSPTTLFAKSDPTRIRTNPFPSLSPHGTEPE